MATPAARPRRARRPRWRRCAKVHGGLLKKRNKPTTQRGYKAVIDRCIVPVLGRKKVQDVKRPDIAALMEKFAYKPAEANNAFGVLRKMFNRPKCGAARTARTRAATFRCSRPARKPGSSLTTSWR